MRTSEADTFWVVWREDGGAPVVKHGDEREAEIEAERLATKHPGYTFIVLEARSAKVVNNIQTVRFTQQIPF